MPPLKKSARLEQDAATWAKHLAATDSFEHASDLKDGENLYMSAQSSGPYTDDGAVHNAAAASWHAEIKDYKFDSPTPHSDTTGVVGHFMQMICPITGTLSGTPQQETDPNGPGVLFTVEVTFGTSANTRKQNYFITISKPKS